MYSGTRKAPPEPLTQVPSNATSNQPSTGQTQAFSPVAQSSRSASFKEPQSSSISHRDGDVRSPASTNTTIDATQTAQSETAQSETAQPGPTSIDSLFPSFKSALDYTIVRDFAYPDFHPLFYGVPLKEHRRHSLASSGDEDSEIADDDDDDDNNDNNGAYGQHNDRAFNEAVNGSGAGMANGHGVRDRGGNFTDGPPWQEDSDLNSPIVTDREGREYEFSVVSADEIHGKAIALFDFVPENDNEVLLREGQIIWVSYRHGQGWLVAENPETGETGLVPEEYVQLLVNSDMPYDNYQDLHQPTIYASPDPETDSEGWVDEGTEGALKAAVDDDDDVQNKVAEDVKNLNLNL